MSDHTIVNLRDGEDQAPKFGFSEAQESRFPWRDLHSASDSSGIAVPYRKRLARRGS